MRKIPWRRAHHPFQYSCLKKSHGQEGPWWATVQGVRAELWSVTQGLHHHHHCSCQDSQNRMKKEGAYSSLTSTIMSSDGQQQITPDSTRQKHSEAPESMILSSPDAFLMKWDHCLSSLQSPSLAVLINAFKHTLNAHCLPTRLQMIRVSNIQKSFLACSQRKCKGVLEIAS